MSERESTQELARRFWRRSPVVFAVAVFLLALGVESLLVGIGLWEPWAPGLRYVGASAGAVAAYQLAAAWRTDARERDRRELERAEA